MITLLPKKAGYQAKGGGKN